jgi:hypothetical protein
MYELLENIRLEAIQMFRDMPDELRGTLYEKVCKHPEASSEWNDPDMGLNWLGRGVAIFLTREKVHHLWIPLDGIVYSMLLSECTKWAAISLISIIHETLGSIDIHPNPDAEPVVSVSYPFPEDPEKREHAIWSANVAKIRLRPLP